MWYCYMCALKLAGNDKKKVKSIFMSALANGRCDCCKNKDVTVDWISEIDINRLEAK